MREPGAAEGADARRAARFRRRLLAIAAGAWILRWYVVLVGWPTSATRRPHHFFLWGDAIYYHLQAKVLWAGGGFTSPLFLVYPGWPRTATAPHPPGYPLFLAALDLVRVQGVTGQRLVSSLLGVGTVVVVGLVTRALAGDRPGLIAAGLAALYPELWISDTALMSEALYALTIALVIAAAYHYWRRASYPRAALLGLALAAATLTRAEAGLLFVVLLVPITWGLRGVSGRTRLALVATAGLVGALALAPWVGYNLARFHRTTTLSTGLGAAMSQGGCHDAWYGNLTGYYAPNCPPLHVRPGGDESDGDAAGREQALDYARHHLGRAPVVVAARVGRVFGLYRTLQTTSFDVNPEGRGWLASWWGLYQYLVMAPFGVAGVVILRRRHLPISPILGQVAAVALAAALTFGVTRYRVPVDVALTICAGIGADAAWRAYRRRRGRAAGADSTSDPAVTARTEGET